MARRAAQGRLHVVGWLRPEPKWTPDRPDMATAASYQELTLASWYLEAPFGRNRWSDVDGIPAVTGTESRRSLGLEGFDSSSGLASLDLALLVKPG